MINGRVHPEGEPPYTGKPRVSITVVNPGDPSRALALEALVDTGATTHLVLPTEIVHQLGLPHRGSKQAVLADGTMTTLQVYVSVVSWHGQTRLAPVFQAAGEPLLGMAMLWGSRLTIDARRNGEVTISPIPH